MIKVLMTIVIMEKIIKPPTLSFFFFHVHNINMKWHCYIPRRDKRDYFKHSELTSVITQHHHLSQSGYMAESKYEPSLYEYIGTILAVILVAYPVLNG